MVLLYRFKCVLMIAIMAAFLSDCSAKALQTCHKLCTWAARYLETTVPEGFTAASSRRTTAPCSTPCGSTADIPTWGSAPRRQGGRGGTGPSEGNPGSRTFRQSRSQSRSNYSAICCFLASIFPFACTRGDVPKCFVCHWQRGPLPVPQFT